MLGSLYVLTIRMKRHIFTAHLLQESLFFVTQAMTSLHWSRLSDHVGRKPIVLIGLFGASLSTLSFGLSRTFWGLVIRSVTL